MSPAPHSAPVESTSRTVQTYVTADVDQATAIGSQLFYHHTLTPLSRDRFVFDLTAASLGPVRVGDLHYSSPVDIEVGNLHDTYGVSLVDHGRVDLAIGSREFAVVPGQAAVVGPVGKLRARGWRNGNDRLKMIRFDRKAMETELSRHLGREVGAPIQFPLPLDERSAQGAAWLQLARVAITALQEPDGILWNPLLAADFSSTLITGLLASTDHQYREELERTTRPAHPRLVKKAMRYIEERAHEAITVPQISAAVGVSPRTLQRAFSVHLNLTPGAYLARVRMDHAHRELVNGSPLTTSVSKVATKWGFFHLGRFASLHRSIYGVQPSETLRTH